MGRHCHGSIYERQGSGEGDSCCPCPCLCCVPAALGLLEEAQSHQGNISNSRSSLLRAVLEFHGEELTDQKANSGQFSLLWKA